MKRMSGKIAVREMDPEACEGCPHRVAGHESTGNRVVDAAAKVETAAIEGVSGEAQHKCGECGCPLANLSLFNRVPRTCPRVHEHGGRK